MEAVRPRAQTQASGWEHLSLTESEPERCAEKNLSAETEFVYYLEFIRSGYISLVAWQQHPIRPQPRRACSAILATVSKAGTAYAATESCPSSSPSTPEVGRQGGVPAEVVHPEGRLLQGVPSLRTGPLHQDYLASVYILERGNGSEDIKSAFLARGESWAAHAKSSLDGSSGWNTGKGIKAKSRVVGEELLLGSPWGSMV
ncbi:uncharacterized protein LOC119299124 [Triticum dicoccoides]|uniref:uncharacterized protein LOC119299124 n=1 Tax=Triticum dicoccoides TaxID=85692 RepID=UPI00188F4B33|nr:uncharacterized protein LOC119299124 [Triticum dicoccoides]